MLSILDIIISLTQNHRQGRTWGFMLRSQSQGCEHAKQATRFTKKCLQSRSATASLLIKRNKFMEEKIKLV